MNATRRPAFPDRASRHGWIVALAAVIAWLPSPAGANCNVIPGTVNAFRGALGATDRPFAMPGDFVELSLRPVCDGASLGVVDHDGDFGIDADDVLVTVMFEPANGGLRNAYVVASNCAAIASRLTACEAVPNVANAVCVEATGNDLVVTPSTSENPARVRFRFPDTDPEIGTPDDDRTLAGPATIAVTPVNLPLPCAPLAAGRCAATGGMIACVDEIYEIDGTCRTGAAQVDPSMSHFVALPPPNDYEAVCDTASTPCDGTATEVRLAVDAAGNAYLPWDYRGVLVRLEDVPIPRLVRGNTTFDAFAGGALDAIRIPGESFLASFSPEGHRLPPIFTPLRDPNAVGQATLFGSVDAPVGVMRIARRGETLQECTGGDNAGLPCNGAADCPSGTCGSATCRGGSSHGNACTSDTGCPGGECGPALFEFRDRLWSGVGPVLVADTEYEVDAESPVPIDGLAQTEQMFSFVVSEGLVGLDLNGDGDATDPVVTLRHRATGVEYSPDRAVARVIEQPFRYAAVALEDDIVAFLEPEPLQGACDASPLACDQNSDEDVFDNLLRVYRFGAGAPVYFAPQTPADALPAINDRSLVVSDGLVFFRTREADLAHHRVIPLTVTPAFSAPDVPISGFASTSEDGRVVSFTSRGTNLVTSPPDTNEDFDVLVRHRDLDGDLRLDEDLLSGLPTGDSTNLLASGAFNAFSAADDETFDSQVSANGSHVIFESRATNVVPSDSNGAPDVFLNFSNVPGLPLRVSLANDESQANQGGSLGSAGASIESAQGAISPDGRFVVFDSSSTNLVGLGVDTNGARDVFLRDLDVDGDGTIGESNADMATIRMNVSSDGAQAEIGSSSGSGGGGVYGNGRFVVFGSTATNLVPGSPGGTFVRDRDTDRDGIFDEASDVATVWLDKPAKFSVPDGASQPIGASSDGRYIAFLSTASNLVPGDTNGRADVFVHDRDGDADGIFDEPGTASTVRASVASSGAQAANGAGPGAFSPDGRFVAFSSDALTPADGNGFQDVFVHDLKTGSTERVSMQGATEADGTTIWPRSITSGARHVLFDGEAISSLFPGFACFLCSYDRTVDWSLGGDLNGDLDFADTFLRVFDADAPATPVDLGPAQSAAVAGGNVVWIDEETGVVRLWRNRQQGPPVDLGVTARAVAISSSWIAALVPETGVALNGDGVADGDLVIQMNALATATAGSWINVGEAADTLQLVGDVVAFATSEAVEGEDLNGVAGGGDGDGDLLDRVLQLRDMNAGSVVNTRRAVDDFVLGESLVAFRVPEASEGEFPNGLNGPGDSDTNDTVLDVFYFGSGPGTLLETAQAATACRIEACDPRRPYRVAGDTVTFLTLESAQGGQDLNGNGLTDDLVLQVFNAAKALAVGTLAAKDSFASTSTGVCSTTGSPCAGDAECGGGVCFVPPGVCIAELGNACDGCQPDPCGADPDLYCQPLPGSPLFCTDENTVQPGICFERQGACKSAADCTPPAACQDAPQDDKRLVASTGAGATAGGTGEQVFTSTGICFENLATACTTDTQCDTAERCRAGTCHRDHGVCANDANCPAGTCTRDLLITATAADADADGVADPFDDCPGVANADQVDVDGDDIGDACDAWICGNGVREGTPGEPGIEECDDGDQDPGDGCDAVCQLETPDCGDGFDNDGDGKIDFGAGPSSDPGCKQVAAPARENPQCSNGIDDDFDGQVDFPADPKCKTRWDNDERTSPPCGLGAELVVALALMRRRMRGRSVP